MVSFYISLLVTLAQFLCWMPGTSSATQVCRRDVLEMGSIDTAKEGKNGRFDAHWVIHAPKKIKNWKLTFTTDKPLTKVQPYDSKLVKNVVGPNTYTFRNSGNQKVILKGQTLKVGFEAFWNDGRQPRILSAVVASTSLPKKLLLCLSTATTAMPHPTTVEPPKCTTRYNYSEVLEKSLLFFEAQRSGKLPANNRIPWRKDSALNDKTENGGDLTGGYYDAGDYVKFGFPMAASITNLAWGMIEFKRGYVFAGQYQYGLDALKWGTDYFIKCHTSKEEFYGQVGDGFVDHAYWGRPEDMTMKRPSFRIDAFKPGSDLAGETAAALAATSIVFKEAGDLEYAEKLLKHAKELFEFANTKKERYSVSIPNAAEFYDSRSGFDDELAWACLWLYKATDDKVYNGMFVNLYSKGSSGSVPEYSWDNKWVGVDVLAATMKMTANHKKLDQLRNVLETTRKTPKGLIFVQVSEWGPNRYAANFAFLSLVASKVIDSEFYTNFARKQIHYMLGDSGRSFVVGFGFNPPVRPYHRSSSCPSPPAPCSWNALSSPDPNPHTLYGALVGGPDVYDDYADHRSDYIKNGVAMDYNAGFQSAIAGLVELAYDGKCELELEVYREDEERKAI